MQGLTGRAPFSRLLAKRTIDADDVLDLRRQLHGDGRIGRHEADALVALARGCGTGCPEWRAYFLEALTDYLVHQEAPAGYISAANAEWLVAAVSADRRVASMLELELLIRVLEAAKSSPAGLSAFALRQVMHAVVEGEGPLVAGGRLEKGRVGIDEVALLRRILHAFGGDGNVAITRAEAEILFTINERTAGAANDPSWNDLFVKAIANFVLCASGYAPPPREEALRREQLFARAEPGIGGFFGRMAAGGFEALLSAYRTDGGAEGEWAARNRAAEIASAAAERIDAAEAAWLAERIGTERPLKANEVALLRFLREAAREVHPDLRPLLDKVA